MPNSFKVALTPNGYCSTNVMMSIFSDQAQVSIIPLANVPGRRAVIESNKL